MTPCLYKRDPPSSLFHQISLAPVVFWISHYGASNMHIFGCYLPAEGTAGLEIPIYPGPVTL